MIYLNVPYDDRQNAKRLGARFDFQTKKWYAPTGKEAELIAQYGDMNAKEEARLAVVALAKRMMPNVSTVSEGFKQGHFMYPGYAFRDPADSE